MKLFTARKPFIERDGMFRWHPWFAWYPVKTDDREVVWLEWVLRRYERFGAYVIEVSYKRCTKLC